MFILNCFLGSLTLVMAQAVVAAEHTEKEQRAHPVVHLQHVEATVDLVMELTHNLTLLHCDMMILMCSVCHLLYFSKQHCSSD
jgi:hypothetical protein